jgi:hypothetical protein
MSWVQKMITFLKNLFLVEETEEKPIVEAPVSGVEPMKVRTTLPIGHNKRLEFWRWFIPNSEWIFRFDLNETEVMETLDSKFKEIHPSLTFDFGPEKDNMRDLIISANGDRDAFPLVKKLVAEAPGLTRWNVVAFRPRKGLSQPAVYQGLTLSASDIYFIHEIDLENEKLALSLFIRDFVEGDERFVTASFLLLDAALGEYDVETKIGFVDFNEWPEIDDPSELAEAGLSPFDKLPLVVDGFIVDEGWTA